MWSDPREVERRRQERARAKIPPEQRRMQLSQEFLKVIRQSLPCPLL